jgi:dolichol-phosphate mannosyltransferase
VIETISPLLSNHFNLTVEMPLKAIVRGHSYRVIPISWRNRASGRGKLALREMGSRYVFIVLYVWLEHTVSRGDCRRRDMQTESVRGAHAVGDLPPTPRSG